MNVTSTIKKLGFSFKINRGKKAVAFFIAFAVFLSPLQFPLSDLISQDILVQNADIVAQINSIDGAAYYRETASAPTLLGRSTTYVRGDHSAKEVPARVSELTLVTPSPETLNQLLATAIITDTALVYKPTKQSARAINNVIAAELVQSGQTSSEVTAVTLDENANITSVVDAHGAKTEAAYDSAGRPTKITDQLGNITYYTYDAQGNITNIYRTETSVVVASTFIEKVVNAVIRPLMALAGFDSSDTTSLAYDQGNITEIVNGSSQSIFEYDEEGLISREVRSDGSSVDYWYDELGNVVDTLETPAEGRRASTLSFNSFFSFTIASILPASYGQRASYNRNNLLANFSIYQDTEIETVTAVPTDIVIQPDNTTLPLTSLSSSVTDTSTTTEIIATTTLQTETSSTSQFATPSPVETAPDATSTTTIDTVEALPVTGETVPEVTSVENLLETVISEVISWVRTSKATIASGIVGIFSLSYADITELATTTSVGDETSEITATTTVDSVAVAQTASEPAAIIPEVVPESLYDLSLKYDAQGNITETKTNFGLTTSYRYDTITDTLTSKIVSQAGGVIKSMQFETNQAARIVRDHNGTYSYTDNNMLAKANDVQYNYDDTSNRINYSGPNDSAVYTYDHNRLLAVNYTSGQKTTYTYDDKGAVTVMSDSVTGDTLFTYEPSGAIASISRGGETIAYTYDSQNRRATRTSNITGTVTYTYTGNNLKKVTGNDNKIIREYFYTPTGELTAFIEDGVLSQVVTDRSRSVTAIVNSVTSAITTQSYDAWGGVINSTLPNTFDLGYAGTFYEPSFSLSILGPRVYDPMIGRFLSKDPLPGIITDKLSQNEYIYAKNDPVNQYDPTGHASEMTDQSTSPKRALVETKSAISGLQTQLSIVKGDIANQEISVTENPDDQSLTDALLASQLSETSLQSSLAILFSIKGDQEATIRENEALAVSTTETNVDSVPLELIISLTTPTTTIETTPAATTSSTTEVSAVEIVGTTTEEASTEFDVLNPVIGLLMAPIITIQKFAGDHLLTAEAKSKKSKGKSKSNKDKKKADSKAKDKQNKNAEKAAKLQKKVNSLQRQLTRLTANESRRAASSRERAIAQISADANVLAAKVNELVQTERAARNKAAQALANLQTTVKVNIASVATAPMKPTVSQPSYCLSCTSLSAGITLPKAGQTTSLTSQMSSYFSVRNAHITLTACGFEQTIVGFFCGTADGLIYLFEGKWGDAGLSLVSTLPLFIGSAADAGKVARLAAATRLGDIAKKIGNGHAYTDHIGEFSHLGIRTVNEFTKHVEIVLKTPSASFTGKNGKEYFWHDASKTFAVIDKNNPDIGTAFIPNRGKAYYDDQLIAFK